MELGPEDGCGGWPPAGPHHRRAARDELALADITDGVHAQPCRPAQGAGWGHFPGTWLQQCSQMSSVLRGDLLPVLKGRASKICPHQCLWASSGPRLGLLRHRPPVSPGVSGASSCFPDVLCRSSPHVRRKARPIHCSTAEVWLPPTSQESQH